MKVSTKGQVTIPIEVREKLGILPNSEVDFIIQGDSVYLVKVSPKNKRRRSGAEIVAHLVGKGTASLGMTTDEIMALTRGWGDDDFDR